MNIKAFEILKSTSVDIDVDNKKYFLRETLDKRSEFRKWFYSECEEREYLTEQQSLWSFVFWICLMLQHLKSLSTSPGVCKHCHRQGYSALDRRKAAALHVWLNMFMWLHMLMSSAGRNVQSRNVCFSGRLCLCACGPQGHWVRVQLCKSVMCPVAGAVCQLLPASPALRVWRPRLPLLWRWVAKK